MKNLKRVIKNQEEKERLERVLSILLEADVACFGKQCSRRKNKVDKT